MCIYYRGGKKRAAQEIVDNLPGGAMFIDVFGGSASVSVAALHAGKWKQVIYNDLDDLLVNFFLVARDRNSELISFLEDTPHGRYLQEGVETLIKSECKISRAAGVFLKLNFSGSAALGADMALLRPRVSGANSLAGGNQAKDYVLERLQAAKATLTRLYFENRDAETLLRLYSTEPEWLDKETNLVFFLDPPYGNTKDYRFDFPREPLIEFFRETQWTVALCGVPESFPELSDFEFIPFLNSKGDPHYTFSRSGFADGMWVKIRDGIKIEKAKQLSLLETP